MIGVRADPFHAAPAELLEEGDVALGKGDVDPLHLVLELLVGLRHLRKGVGLRLGL